ncbi:MAG TPA: hypothetical protein VE869_06290 [Gemmatimonas sp.]|nr:hypothetical protein [Gemmatimonas sp.]
METLDAGNADLFRDALVLMDWWVREIRAGRRIVSVDAQEDILRGREFSTPLLDSAGTIDRERHIALHGVAFDQVVQILQRPPQPTAALRALVAEAFAELDQHAVTESVARKEPK